MMEGDDARAADRALVARVAAGDRDALETLYRRHAGWLTSRLQSRCGDPEMTDLAVQDAFLAVWRSAKTYKGQGDVGAWIWGIGIRRLIDLLRKRRTTPVDPAFIVRATSTADAQMPSADDTVLGDGTYGDLADALRGLPADLHAVLLATAIDGLTTKEAATLLGVPQGTVKTRLMRARRQLKEALA